MKTLKITTVLKDPARSIEHDYVVPENMAELIEMDGEAMVFQECLKGRIVTRRSQVKALLKMEDDNYLTDKAIIEQVNAEAATWSPTEGRTSDPTSRVRKFAAKAEEAGVTIEEQIELLKSLL
jgi:hypothetical protein